MSGTGVVADAGPPEAGPPDAVPTSILTARLVLRRWRTEDLAPFAAMNADPAVMRWFPATMTAAASDAWVHERVLPSFAEHGFGPWALERRDTGEFIGFTGLLAPLFEAPFMPAVEIGWRLAAAHWGHGYATEAARAAVADGFDRLHLGDIVSLTAEGNLPSRRVMERLGMTHDPADDFDHPRLPPTSPLRRHVLYRLRAPVRAAGPVSPDAGGGRPARP